MFLSSFRVCASALAALAMGTMAGTAGATVHPEAREALLRQLRVCQQLENQLFIGAQDPNLDLLDLRAVFSTNVACLRELVGDLEGASPAGIGVSDAHYAQAGKQLATALALEEKDLARLDAKLAGGKPATKAIRGLVKAMKRKSAASASRHSHTLRPRRENERAAASRCRSLLQTSVNPAMAAVVR